MPGGRPFQLLLAAAMSTTAAARAEPVTLPDTAIEHLTAASNGIAYKLFVSLPPGHAGGTGEIQAVLLLDADYSFPLAHAIGAHLRERRDLPDLLVVSIGYDGPPAYKLNRTRDYTPVHSADPGGGYGPEYQAHSGGGPKFFQFIATELMPMLRKKYRAAPKPLLVGHSYGGLFAAWAILTRPEALAGAIIVSPSLWYENNLLWKLEAGLPAEQRALPRKFYAAVGALEGNPGQGMVEDLNELGRRLSTPRYKATAGKVQVLDDETHNSVFPRALTNGLRYFWPRGSFAISKAPGTRMGPR